MGPLGVVLGNLSACQKCWLKRWVLCHARAELRARDLGKRRVIASPRALGVRGSEDVTWDFENLARGTACSSPRGEPLPARRSCLLKQGWASWLSYPGGIAHPTAGQTAPTRFLRSSPVSTPCLGPWWLCKRCLLPRRLVVLFLGEEGDTRSCLSPAPPRGIALRSVTRLRGADK